MNEIELFNYKRTPPIYCFYRVVLYRVFIGIEKSCDGVRISIKILKYESSSVNRIAIWRTVFKPKFLHVAITYHVY